MEDYKKIINSIALDNAMDIVPAVLRHISSVQDKVRQSLTFFWKLLLSYLSVNKFWNIVEHFNEFIRLSFVVNKFWNIVEHFNKYIRHFFCGKQVLEYCRTF